MLKHKVLSEKNVLRKEKVLSFKGKKVLSGENDGMRYEVRGMRYGVRGMGFEGKNSDK